MGPLRKAIVFCSLLFCLAFAGIVQGQYYFGRNKVHYNQFEWHVLRTEHFDIYYYPEMETLAEIGAFYAEESYNFLKNKFNQNILIRIPLVFYSSHFHFQETNTISYLIPQGLGGFFEFIKGRVVIPSDGNMAQFRHTIRHELVHVFMKSTVERTLKDHRILQFREVPLWFTEGLAEYWSEGWTSDAEMILRDLVLNSRLFPLGRMASIWGTYLMYKEGQSILKTIAETYGEDKILRLLHNVWKSEDFSQVMKLTLGQNYNEFSEAWEYQLEKELFPLLESRDLPSRVTRQVTENGYHTLPVFYRENGIAKAVFMADRDGYSTICLKNLNSITKENPEVLIRGERSDAFESFHIQQSKIDVDSLGRLVFAAKKGPRDVLYVHDMNTGKQETFSFPELVSLFSPAWSPDGNRIAMTGLDKTGCADVYCVDTRDGSLERLTRDHFDDRDPDWSPDGNSLVFSSDRGSKADGSTHLFIMKVGTGALFQLTDGMSKDRNPAWSPDGRYIAFSSDRDGVFNLYALECANPEPGNGWSRPDLTSLVVDMRQVTHLATAAMHPCWTDSLELVFTAFENISFQIHVTPCLDTLLESPVQDSREVRKAETAWSFPRIDGMRELSRGRYKKKFSLDIAQSQVIHDPIYGTSGGGQLLITDVMGDEQYYFLLYNNAQVRSELWDGFNIAVSRTDLSRRVNYSTGLYRLAGNYYNEYEGYYYERRYGGYFSVSYPLNVFERLETTINIRHSERDWVGIDQARKAVPVSNFISYTRDNTLWGPTGPLDGGRYAITLGNTVDIIHSNVNFTTVSADLRRYFRIGSRMCHAVRILGQFNMGKEPLPFVMGGSWDLRGYRLWSLWGPKLFLVSNEFRFPFLDQFYLGFPFGGILFSSVRGALFVDVGNVWDQDFGELKGSFGFGLRLSLGGILVLRLDVGRRTNFKAIEQQTFTQFFFGWDF